MLPQADLIKTSPLDQGSWSYQGVLGWVSRRRLRLVSRLLETAADDGTLRVGNLLEVGYGSGLFMPALTRWSTHLFGVDVHEHAQDVSRTLAVHGIGSDLRTGSVTDLPFPDDSMDVVVCISALEFVDELDDACREMRRVLRPGGHLVVVTPGHSPVLDLGLQLLTGERAEDTFQGRRQAVVPTLKRHFRVERTVTAPPLAPSFARLYAGLLLSPLEDDGPPAGPPDDAVPLGPR